MNTRGRHWIAAPRFTPVVGALIGAVGGGVYWLSALLWPASIAVIVSMLATALLAARADADGGPGATFVAGDHSSASAGAGAQSSGAPSRSEPLRFVFAVLVKYNALMALSAANLPFALPANLALGLIMVAGQASSRALVVSVLVSPGRPAAAVPASHGDLALALALGFAPAVLIGIPGLIGLAAAIITRMAYIAYVRRRRPSVGAADLDATQQLTELCFYLGALASWAYI